MKGLGDIDLTCGVLSVANAWAPNVIPQGVDKATSHISVVRLVAMLAGPIDNSSREHSEKHICLSACSPLCSDWPATYMQISVGDCKRVIGEEYYPESPVEGGACLRYN